MDERNIIFVGVAIYIAIMALVAVYSSRRAGTATDFVLAGRGLSLGLCTTTIVATWFGGGMLMGGSGAAYEDGLLGVIADPFGATLCLLLIGGGAHAHERDEHQCGEHRGIAPVAATVGRGRRDGRRTHRGSTLITV